MTIGEERSFLDQLMDLYRAGDSSATDDSPGTLMVRAIQQFYLQIAMQNYAAATEFMTEDFEMEILGPSSIPLTGSWRGRQGIAQVIEHNFSQLEDQNPQLIGVTAHQDAVLIMGRETGRVKSTQVSYSVHWVQWFTFRGPQFCRFLEIFDSENLSIAFEPRP